MAWLPDWLKMTLPELAMLVGIFANLCVTVGIAFKAGQKVQKIDEHERRIGEAEAKVERHGEKISDTYTKIGKIEGEIKELYTRTAR